MINESEILEAQKLWSDGIINIGKLKNDSSNLIAFTKQFLKKNYDFDNGVQFKPTKASKNQFRNDIESALSYFLGDNNKYPEDKGFALEPWLDVEFINDSIKFYDNICIAMGNYFFTKVSGEKVKVEYSFAYKKNKNLVKIILHHSSIPFAL
mgnify:FL=1